MSNLQLTYTEAELLADDDVAEPLFAAGLRCHGGFAAEGTALAHLESGLFEAHARDEAGWDGLAGHKQMWFAARDVAFEAPPTEDETQTMLVRMGIVPAGGAPPTPEEQRAMAEAAQLF